MGNCSCGGTKLLFACSGAADVGAVADRVVRKLAADGAGKMYCLAGVGAKLDAFIKTAKDACGIVAVDGCPVQCAKKTLEGQGLTVKSFTLTDMGLKKGETKMSDDLVASMAATITQAL